MEKRKKPAGLFQKQVLMRRMILAMLPCIAGAVYFFGWRSLAMVVVSCLLAFLTEYLFCRSRGERVSEAVLVTGAIFALIMPPTVPWHVLGVGVVFSIAFSKMVFGGFGRNIFNPAMAGRCFVYVCFPVALTARWALPAQGSLGALLAWSSAQGADAFTAATPMALMKAGEGAPALGNLFFGRIAGTMGVTSALLILIGGIYLYKTRTAARETILSCVVVYAALNVVLRLLGGPRFPGALHALLGGGYLFGAFYMATDPISSPRTKTARILYGALIAGATLVIRNFSIFNGGMMFAILLGNMFAPILDYAVNAKKKTPKKNK